MTSNKKCKIYKLILYKMAIKSVLQVRINYKEILAVTPHKRPSHCVITDLKQGKYYHPLKQSN